jgi:hypothetical protein
MALAELGEPKHLITNSELVVAPPGPVRQDLGLGIAAVLAFPQSLAYTNWA